MRLSPVATAASPAPGCTAPTRGAGLGLGPGSPTPAQGRAGSSGSLSSACARGMAVCSVSCRGWGSRHIREGAVIRDNVASPPVHRVAASLCPGWSVAPASHSEDTGSPRESLKNINKMPQGTSSSNCHLGARFPGNGPGEHLGGSHRPCSLPGLEPAGLGFHTTRGRRAQAAWEQPGGLRAPQPSALPARCPVSSPLHCSLCRERGSGSPRARQTQPRGRGRGQAASAGAGQAFPAPSTSVPRCPPYSARAGAGLSPRGPGEGDAGTKGAPATLHHPQPRAWLTRRLPGHRPRPSPAAPAPKDTASVSRALDKTRRTPSGSVAGCKALGSRAWPGLPCGPRGGTAAASPRLPQWPARWRPFSTVWADF